MVLIVYFLVDLVMIGYSNDFMMMGDVDDVMMIGYCLDENMMLGNYHAASVSMGNGYGICFGTGYGI